MQHDVTLAALLALHAALFAVAAARMRRPRAKLNRTHLVWAALLPVFGPASLLLLIRAASRPDPDMGWMRQADEDHRFFFNIRTAADDTVPLEEALLINDPHRRRTLMLSILRSDPMAYLDLLMVARFNEDTETAHYAASTIMELQRQMQMEIQRRQHEIQRGEADMEARLGYVDLLQRYVDSGLLEGQFLRRQRMVLVRAIQDALSVEPNERMLDLLVRNALQLGQPSDAKAAADRMLREWPLSESAWLANLRVAVETRDSAQLRDLLARMKRARIDWTKNGREQLALWTEGAR